MQGSVFHVQMIALYARQTPFQACFCGTQPSSLATGLTADYTQESMHETSV